MGYEIRFVSELPKGHDFVLVALPDSVVILYRESAVCPRVLEDSWAAFRTLERPQLAYAV